jgi:hypothetical protein
VVSERPVMSRHPDRTGGKRTVYGMFVIVRFDENGMRKMSLLEVTGLLLLGRGSVSQRHTDNHDAGLISSRGELHGVEDHLLMSAALDSMTDMAEESRSGDRRR